MCLPLRITPAHSLAASPTMLHAPTRSNQTGPHNTLSLSGTLFWLFLSSQLLLSHRLQRKAPPYQPRLSGIPPGTLLSVIFALCFHLLGGLLRDCLSSAGHRA